MLKKSDHYLVMFVPTLRIIFSVPSDPEKKNAWIAAIESYQQFDHFLSKFYVCELHFGAESVRKIGSRTILVPNALPTIFPVV